MQLNFVTRASWTTTVADDIFRRVRASFEAFFRHAPEVPEEIDVVAYAAKRAGKFCAKDLICITPSAPDPRQVAGVSVMVHIQGTQGLFCTITVPDWDIQKLRTMIEEGPYKHRPRASKSSQEPPAAPDSPILIETREADDNISAPNLDEIAEEAVHSPVERTEEPGPAPHIEKPAVRLSPLEKLKAAYVSEEEIERLRITMASIVYRQAGKGEIPNTLQVPVEAISQAAREHMKLPLNGSGNYQGIIGNFYATRIAYFGVKWGDSLDPGAQYSDWLIDATLVLDFVGGRNQLAALTHVREMEVAERKHHEERAIVAPPPTAEAIQEAAATGFMADAELLDMVARMCEGREEAENALALARENAQQVGAERDRLKKVLAEATAAYDSARKRVAEAELAVQQFTLSSEVLERVRETKERFKTLLGRLGI